MVTPSSQVTEEASRDTSAVSIEKLTYRYPRQEEPILQDIDLEILPGEFVLLMGSTGSGKSTLSLCLNGVIPRMLGGRLEGNVQVMGWSPSEYDIYQMATKIGIVFQDADSQLANIFVRDEVAFGAQNLLVPREEILARIERVLHFVGLDEYQDRSVFNLSGGEKQRVAIASVLAMEPEVVVYDEPTANLDPVGTAEVQSLVQQLNDEHGITTIVIEHDIARFVDVADRLVVISEGGIEFHGPPRDLLRQHGLRLRDELGLRIPQASEFALEAQEKGYAFSPFPLTVDEVEVEALDFRPRSAPSQQENGKEKDGEPESVIQMEAVTFHYPDGPDVLRNISTTIPKGKMIGILGENGSGKTTLASLMVGLNKPASGQVTVCGLNANEASMKSLAEKVSYVFQYPEHQFIADTVFEEMAFNLQGDGLESKEVERRSMEMLERFELDHVKDRHPLALSRGQKRRLSVASMLVLRPEVFILDEPTTGQDYRNIEQVMRYLADLKAEGLTIILVTHDMELVARYAEHLIVLNEGEVVFDGDPLKLFGDVISEDDEFSLTLPDVFRLYKRVRTAHGWLPPPKGPRELAEMLEAREG